MKSKYKKSEEIIMKKDSKHIIWPLFIRFLKKEKCFGRYINNFHSDNGKNMREYHYGRNDISFFITNDLFIKNGFHLLNRAFKWDETEEGYSFWDDLNFKWHKILRS